jgi:hypothetical protein
VFTQQNILPSGLFQAVALAILEKKFNRHRSLLNILEGTCLKKTTLIISEMEIIN